MVTCPDDKAARVWAMPSAAVEPMDQLVLKTELGTGLKLGPDGVTHVLDASEWHRRRGWRCMDRHPITVRSGLAVGGSMNAVAGAGGMGIGGNLD